MTRRPDPDGRGAPRGGERPGAESGVTLIELLVVVAILGAVLGALTGGVITLQRASYQVDVRTDDVSQARLALESASRALRATTTPPSRPGATSTDPPFEVAQARHATFTAYLGDPDVPVRIDLRVDDAGTLTERMRTPTVAADGTVTWRPQDERVRVLARSLGAGRVFTYEAADDDGTTYLLGDAPTDNQRRQVQLVRIDVTVGRDGSGRVAPQRLSTEVRLPNRSGS